jgi:GT2 family glycosyltransferase
VTAATPAVPKPAASVIVLTYNARAFIAECLTGLADQTFTDFETIVVDNASSDGTADYIRDKFPSVRVLESPTNGGYGAGNNLGAAHARGETLVLLNPDAVPDRHWLAYLLGAMHDYQRRVATSKIVLRSDPRRLNSSGNQIHYLGQSFCRGLNAPATCYSEPELVSGASGAACAISHELFKRIDGFDSSIFLYHDDVDLSLRALLAGEPCLYVPDAVVAHDYEMTLPPVKWGWIEAYRYAVLLKAFDVRTLVLITPALLALEALTLLFLATRGGDSLAAKLETYGWVVRNLPTILRRRRRAQATRALSDRELLGALVDRMPYEQVAPGAMARVASLLVDPWFRLYRQLLLAAVTW